MVPRGIEVSRRLGAFRDLRVAIRGLIGAPPLLCGFIICPTRSRPMQNLAISRNLWYSFGMVGSQSRFRATEEKGRRGACFLQPDARVAQPEKGRQDFFI